MYFDRRACRLAGSL